MSKLARKTGICVLSAFLSLAWVVPVKAEISSIGSAINKAGRQRMLTQRMVKAYCMIGIDVGYANAQTQRDKAITLFESQLQELEAFTATNKEELAVEKSVRYGPALNRWLAAT